MSDGLVVMIHRVFGSDPAGSAAYKASIGKTIASVAVVNNELQFRMADGTGFTLVDMGQSCCESRYMTCDDDLPYYEGAEFLGAEVRDGPCLPEGEGRYGDHDQQFLVVETSKGSFTVANHNEHNGYYGGFAISAGVLP